MTIRKQYLSFVLVLTLIAFAIIFGGWVAKETKISKPDYYFEIDKNLKLFGKVYEEIAMRYVEEIDPEKFMKSGINGMLRTLDPYTVFLEQEENSELQIRTKGKYGGVGMPISKREGWPTVVEPPFEGTPAARAGIREGDKIIEVDGKATDDLTISETAQRLRGEVGTEVYIKIRRVGEEKPLEFRLIRAEIKISDVSYAGFIKDKIGYIRLGHFSRFAGKQVRDSIAVLKRKGMESLIFDLRGNPGGLLEAAVQVAENFINKGDMIVYTKGRASGTNIEYRSKELPIWSDKPLVILVDEYSASASEIVAGAVQDLDRGLIIGSPTFGKGLVQTLVPLTRQGTSLKITTAKYYIPSGRLIQKPNFIRSKEILWGYEKDTTKTKEEDEYYTASKRKVHGKGGIVPDIKVESTDISPLVANLIMKSMFFNFALEYASDHKDLNNEFIVDDRIIFDFKEFLKSKDFTYKTRAEMKIEELEKVIKQEKYPEAVTSSLEQLESSIDEAKEKDFERDLDLIKWNLKTEIAAKLWGTSGKYNVEFQWHPEIQKAVEVLSNKNDYFSLLSSNVDIQ
ncbi:MAG: S41 family peptidase [bacterium]|nr:MAG: S41 family peptidase [bacterium]